MFFIFRCTCILGGIQQIKLQEIMNIEGIQNVIFLVISTKINDIFGCILRAKFSYGGMKKFHHCSLQDSKSLGYRWGDVGSAAFLLTCPFPLGESRN